MNREETSERDQGGELVIDAVLSTQPELGPSVPDGGFGWLIFVITLFFQLLIPCLTVNFGIFLCYINFETTSSIEHPFPSLWDSNFMYVPLFFALSWTISEPFTRGIIHHSTWPRLTAVAAICLTSAGLLFVWMGIVRMNQNWIYIIAGIIAGFGASLQLSQCDILLAQYFRLKHTILLHISYAVVSLGFIFAPIIVGHSLFKSHISNVLLWYQAILLQGLILILPFRKPQYLKSHRRKYNFLPSAHDDDEEDIFSKNSKELQIRRDNQSIQKISINNNQETAGPSGENSSKEKKRKWETFEDIPEADYTQLNGGQESLKREWETFEEDEDVPHNMTLDKELKMENEKANRITTAGNPVPLFSDLPVNNNITYSFDDAIIDESPSSNVFVVNPKTKISFNSYLQLELLKQPTFYKTLLMVITTKFSHFIFFTTFSTYLYQEVQIKIRPTIVFTGQISVISFLFAFFSYGINISKQKRPLALWVLCWVGAAGYLLISDSLNQVALKIGASQVILSIAALDYIGKPLLGLTFRGEQKREFLLISILSGLSFLIFLFFDIRLRTCFRCMAVLHFATGCIWFTNFVYKKIKEIR